MLLASAILTKCNMHTSILFFCAYLLFFKANAEKQPMWKKNIYFKLLSLFYVNSWRPAAKISEQCKSAQCVNYICLRILLLFFCITLLAQFQKLFLISTSLISLWKLIRAPCLMLGQQSYRSSIRTSDKFNRVRRRPASWSLKCIWFSAAMSYRTPWYGAVPLAMFYLR